MLIFHAGAQAAAGECDAILLSGVKNTFQELRAGDFAQSFQSAYCRKLSSSQSSSSGAQVGGSYAGFGLSFGKNSSDTAASRQENCGSNASAMSNAQYFNALQSVADPAIVAAWKSCTTKAYAYTP
jgi:hypothetical protein